MGKTGSNGSEIKLRELLASAYPDVLGLRWIEPQTILWHPGHQDTCGHGGRCQTVQVGLDIISVQLTQHIMGSNKRTKQVQTCRWCKEVGPALNPVEGHVTCDPSRRRAPNLHVHAPRSGPVDILVPGQWSLLGIILHLCGYAGVSMSHSHTLSFYAMEPSRTPGTVPASIPYMWGNSDAFFAHLESLLCRVSSNFKGLTKCTSYVLASINQLLTVI